ncbi:MAG: hypothetical protein GC136_08250 [Alphaproteobacteria bacterium]|nr:hypothetical protein [Alphaproteobacteria bacterium]
MSESDLWYYIVQDVKPLKGKSVPKAPASTPARAQKAVTTYVAPPKKIVKETLKPETVDWKVEKKIRRGKVDIDATLDLHGHTQAKAEGILESFILNAIQMKNRCILVITGRGTASRKSVLKEALPNWLTHNANIAPYIMGFREAAQHHGGAGAFYVLLRKPR